jgi:hypothetical protein
MRRGEPLDRGARGLQALRIDVHQRERGALELGLGEQVAGQIAGEHGGARTDERDPRHGG